jgi:alpha-ketoglutarate-dependent taurine dioxygenase
MPMEVVNLSETIGSEILGPVRELLAAEVAAELKRLLIDRGVLVFRGLNITADQQLTLAGLVGTIRPEGENGIFKITLDTNKGGKSAEYLKGSFQWQLDGTHDDVAIFASILSAKALSDTDGETEFANSCAAYEAVPDETKARIADLEVVHSVQVFMRRSGVDTTGENVHIWRMSPATTHKLVWNHQDGRKSLVIGIHASHVVGVDLDDGDALLSELLEWITRPRFRYRHQCPPATRSFGTIEACFTAPSPIRSRAMA